MKRAISMILCLVLIGSLLPASALALDLGGAAAVGSEAAVEELVIEESVAEAPVEEEAADEAVVDGAAEVLIDENNFPDDQFRHYISAKLDTDEDGILSADEISAVTSISVPGKNIVTLEGIEIFSSLEKLDCRSNGLTDLDVSGNTELTTLECGINYLTDLDVSWNTKLTTLGCRFNKLTSLDVSNNPQLVELDFQSNSISSIDLSNNKELLKLDCGSNKLTDLDVSLNKKLIRLTCSANDLSSLDVSNNIALQVLHCDTNEISSLDVRDDAALRSLQCYGNELTRLDVRSNTLLTFLTCGDNKLSSLDVSNNTALETLACEGNYLTSLEVGQNTVLNTLICDYNNLTALDVGSNTQLTYLSCGYNELGSLDVSHCTELDQLTCVGNKLTELDVSSAANLTRLWCDKNELTYLDVTGNPMLSELECGSNKLTSLDVSKNAALERLVCYKNMLTSLDVSGNKELTQLTCYNNSLSSLTLNRALRYLNCEQNNLTNLDVSRHSKLTNLKCSGQSTTLNAVRGNGVYELHLYELVGEYNVDKIASVDCGVLNEGTGVLTLSGKPETVTYTYDDGSDLDELTVTVTVDYALPAPQLTVSNNDASGKPRLAWDSVSGAEKYEIWRSASKNGTYSKIYTTANTFFNNTSAVAGKTYYYKVRAVYADGAVSDFSSVKNMTCDYARPDVSISCNESSGKPKLTWPAVEGATKYEIWRSTSKNGTYSKMYTTTNTYYNNTSAVVGKTYYYKVRALGASSYATSAFSVVDYVTCDCSSPVVNVATNANTGKPVLSWEAVDGAVKYEVWRAYSKNGTYYKMGTTTGTTYTNTSAKANTTYYYKVKAIGTNTYATSAFSTVKNMTCDCARPVVTATTNASGKPKLTWDAVDGAVKYEIWRSGYRNGTYTKIYTTTNTFFNNTTAGSGYTYFYKVRAVGSSSYATSAYSSVVSAKCK